MILKDRDLHKFYLRLPKVLQDICVVIQGARLNRRRYGGIHKRFLMKIKSHLSWTNEELEAYQRSLLDSLFLKASEAPYYRELFKKIKFQPGKTKDISQLKQFPILEKKVVQGSGKSFLVQNCDYGKLIKIKTTGTTGKPLLIYCTPKIRQKHYAFYERYLNSIGIESNSKRATIGGRIIVPFDVTQPPFWKYSPLQRNLLFSSYHLKDENVGFYLTKLRRYQPVYIESYPSSIYTLASFAKKQKINAHGITKFIITSGETLYEEQRSTIENAFGTKVFDHYGTAEMCVFIAQCEQGTYHVHTDYSIVEFLREDGVPAAPGEEADVVCTALLNDVMPLIRYRVGDRVVVGEGKCKCGLPFPTVERIIGRQDDSIVTPDGRIIGRLSPVLKGFPVKEAQYVQESLDSLKIILVKDRGFDKGTEFAIKKELEKRIGKEIRIRFAYVTSIHRGPGGKFRSVVSLVDNTEVAYIPNENH